MKILSVLLGSQLSYSVSSVNKTGLGTIRVHAKPAKELQNEPILHVVNINKQTTRLNRRQTVKNENAENQKSGNQKSGKPKPKIKKTSDSKESTSRISSQLKTINEVTALFSNTFQNIFKFQENRPATGNKLSFQTKSHSGHAIPRINEKENRGWMNSLNKRDSNLAQDYAAAYDDYIESVIGSDLEDAVNGDGNTEYYYSDDYIDYEFDSISQIEDTTTHETLKIENNRNTTSNTPIGYPGQQQMWSPEPVVLFSIALTLLGLLQIFFSRSKNNNQSGSLSCLPDDGDVEDDFIQVADVQIKIHDRLVEVKPKNKVSANEVSANEVSNDMKNEKSKFTGKNKKSHLVWLDRIDEEILSM